MGRQRLNISRTILKRKKNKERDTYEVPGGHREIGEDILEKATRELREETGAIEVAIKPVCAYSVKGKTKITKRCGIGVTFHG